MSEKFKRFSWFKKYTTHFALLLLLVPIAYLSGFKISNVDIGWHLKTGEYFYLHHAIPGKDDLSWTSPEGRYPIGTLLPDTIFYLVYHVSGFKGLVLTRVFLVCILFILLFFLTKHLNPRQIGFNVIVLFFLYTALRLRIPIRPLLLSQICMAATLLLLTRHIQSKKRIYFWGALALPVLNANLHGEWMMAGLLWAILAMVYVWVHKKESWRNRLWNPYMQGGVGAFGLIIGLYFVSPMVKDSIDVLFLVQKNFALFTDMSEQGRPQWHPKYFRLYGFLVVLSIAWIYQATHFAKQKGHLLRTFFFVQPLVWGLLIMKLVRIYPYGIIASLPLILITLADLELHLKEKIKPVFKASVFGALFLGLFFLNIFNKAFPMGFNLNPVLHSAEGLNFLKNNLPQGNMFNSYELGSMLALYLHPHKKVFIDPRMTVHQSKTYGLFQDIMRTKGGWEKFFEKNNITFCVIPSHKTALATTLLEHYQWGLIFWDPVMMVFLKNSSENITLFQKFHYRWFNPFDLKKINLLSPIEKKKDIQQLLQQAPKSSIPYFVAGHAAWQKKNWEEAMENYRILFEMKADAYYPATHLGMSLVMLKKFREAEYFLKLGVKTWPKDHFPLQQLINYYKIVGNSSQEQIWSSKLKSLKT